MDLISLVIYIALIGFVVWLIGYIVPMPEGFKRVIYGVALLIVVLIVLRAFGLLSGFPDLRVR